MTIKALYPTVRPTLNLDFAKTKALDPRVTFSRASTATFVGANGLIQTAASGAPRFDHNPATGESLGLLVEEARTNNVLYSEQINSSNWNVITGALSLDSSLSPSGTQPYLFTSSNSSSGGGYVYRSIGSLTGNHTVSVYVKKNGAQKYAWIDLWAGADYVAVFDLDTGTYAGNSGLNSYDSYSITSVGNGWFRVTGTKNLPAGSYSLGLSITRDPTGGSGVVNSSGDSILIWGAQVEAGSFPTSYIPTTTATVTRAADVASMTGTNFSSWYRQDEGTAYIKTVNRSINSPAAPLVFSVGAGGFPFNELLEWDGTGSTNAILLRVFTTAGVQSANITGTVNSANNVNIAAGAFKLNNFAVSLNGNTPLVDNSGDLSAVDTLHIGKNWSTSRYSGTIARLAYYPVRLPDAQLQALTAT